MKKFIYTVILPLFFFPFISEANETFSVEIEALTLVMEKYSRESDQLKNLKNVKPSYLALKHDECNATVKVTNKTGLEIQNTESFDVNICKKEINRVIN